MPRSRSFALLALSFCFALCVPALARQEEKSDRPAASDPVVVVAPSVAKALEMVPDAVILTAEQYRNLQEELARLRLLVERPAAQSPTELSLEGKVEGNLVSLKATYRFRTEKAGELVRLGGSPAQATAVSLDGKTPRLIAGRPGNKGRDEDGFTVVIDKPNDKDRPHHELTLDLVLPLLARNGGQGFTIDLPRAAITRIELDMPAGVRDVRAGGKTLFSSGLTLKGAHLSGHPVANDKLELDWKATAATAAAAVTTADGAVSVRLDRQSATTKAVLTLRVLSGQTKAWTLVVPPKAKLSFAPADQARLDGDPTEDKPGQRTIRLKEASAEPLVVTVISTAKAPNPLANKTLSVGPFNVVGAVKQQGNVLISTPVTEWHVETTARGDLTRRAPEVDELRADPALAVAFRYGPGEAGVQPSGLPWLDLEVDSVSGQLKAKPSYLLTLLPAEKDVGPRWQLQATLTVTPRRTGIVGFEVGLPEGCAFDSHSVSLPDRVRSVNHDSKSVVRFQLDSVEAEALSPVTVKFEANYVPLEARAESARLALPRLQGMLEQDGEVRVKVPLGVELLVPEMTPGLELATQTVTELHYRYARRAPGDVEVLWRQHRPIVRADALIDLTLAGGQAHVRHELRYQLPPSAPGLSLDVPAAVAANVEARHGKLTTFAGGFSVAPGGDGVLVLEYDFALPEAGEPILVPLVRPRGCHGETRVRVWSESGSLPSAPIGWQEQNLEEVAGRDRLPVLVVRSGRLDQALTLSVPSGEAASRALIERALVRVKVNDGGVQAYRVSYRLGHLSGRRLDFELPAPAREIGLTCTLDGRGVEYDLLPTAEAAKVGRQVRLRLAPHLIKRPSVLELSYHLEPHRLAGQTPLTTSLMPPRPLGERGFASRWSVTTPENWVLLGPEPGPGSPIKWGPRRFLYAPSAATSAADLESWFGGEAAAEAVGSPSLAAWREGDESFRMTHASRQVWLVICSLTVAVLGLVLSRLALSSKSRRAALAWVLIVLVGLGAALLAVLTPGLAAQLAYGCQPGLLVLALIVAAQWLLHERRRRKVVFLPSFSRPKQGSSLTRQEVPRQPSTVDAPRTGSSLGRVP